MKILKRILKFTLISCLFLIVVVVCFGIYVWNVAEVKPPQITEGTAFETLERSQVGVDSFELGNNWIRKNEYGLYEMYVEGSPYERGIVNGKLSEELIVGQEEAFTDFIKNMVPSEKYLKFLKYVVGFVNRDLESNITDEYKAEIFGISKASSDSFNWIGDKYSRQLNYHSAHDVGHALQSMMLVGCTSLSAWDGKTTDGAMIIGRNFDFWSGDKFAENKIVSFVNPDQGYKFGFVTWGAFIGVCSGINEKGLTVTINAAKSDIPFNTATPVSLVAREILQYAGNIEQAIAIAKKREMFVSESFMIGSARDRKTVVIEKTPDKMDIYYPSSNKITCTNHYQSPGLKNQTLNLEQKVTSASVYRQERLEQLVEAAGPLDVAKMAGILRDTRGINNKHIGLGNEKAVNQLIAHHSVIFVPDSLQMWVSTAPWQLGTYVCYDLRKVFAATANNEKPIYKTIVVANNNIAPDTAMINSLEFQRFLGFRAEKNKWLTHQYDAINPMNFTSNNVEFYDAYRLAGDYYARENDMPNAINAYKTALRKEVATQTEQEAILKKIKKLEQKQ